jgi:hypothetical protein
MATQTPNYAFDMPLVGGDENVWGTFLNANWSSLDAILKNQETVAGTKVAKEGDIMTGTLVVEASVTATNFVATDPGTVTSTLYRLGAGALLVGGIRVTNDQPLQFVPYDVAGAALNAVAMRFDRTASKWFIGTAHAANLEVVTISDLEGNYVPIATDTILNTGYTHIIVDDGDVSNTTYIPEVAGGNYRKALFGGTMVFQAPVLGGAGFSSVVLVDNTAAAAVTFSNWEAVTGDALNAVAGVFMCYITRMETYQTLHIQKVA